MILGKAARRALGWILAQRGLELKATGQPVRGFADFLAFARSQGLAPATVYDVGVGRGTEYGSIRRSPAAASSWSSRWPSSARRSRHSAGRWSRNTCRSGLAGSGGPLVYLDAAFVPHSFPRTLA